MKKVIIRPKKSQPHISCAVCQDLIPLVQDQVASGDSAALVKNHIKTCTVCKALYELEREVPAVDDQRVLHKIVRHLAVVGLLFLVAGVLLGVFFTNSSHMFYNFLIMPAAGAIALFLFPRHWPFVPAGIFLLTFVWTTFGLLREGAYEAIFPSLLYSVVYAVLCLLGMAAAVLLRYAFQNEKQTTSRNGGTHE